MSDFDSGNLTLGETGSKKTGNLLDQALRSNEGVILASELLDQLLVLVQLLQVVGRHGVDTAVLGTVNIVLVTEDADAHVRAGDGRQADSAGETLVTLRVIVLKADLKPVSRSAICLPRALALNSPARKSTLGVGKKYNILNGLKEVALLLVQRVLQFCQSGSCCVRRNIRSYLEQVSDVLTHTGYNKRQSMSSRISC